jgi:hypothetical protein
MTSFAIDSAVELPVRSLSMFYRPYPPSALNFRYAPFGTVSSSPFLLRQRPGLNVQSPSLESAPLPSRGPAFVSLLVGPCLLGSQVAIKMIDKSNPAYDADALSKEIAVSSAVPASISAPPPAILLPFLGPHGPQPLKRGRWPRDGVGAPNLVY